MRTTTNGFFPRLASAAFLLICMAALAGGCADSAGFEPEGTNTVSQTVVDSDGDGLPDTIECDDPTDPASCVEPDNCPTMANPADEYVGDLTCSVAADCVDSIDDSFYADGTERPLFNGGGRDGQPIPVICDRSDDDTLGRCGVQPNNDWDALGDPCDPDDDNDGRFDEEDGCPEDFNPAPVDIDEDGIEDACDPDVSPDTDGDGISDDDDNCPEDANADQADADSDGIGDLCDDDRDGDTVLNDDDNCPDVPNTAQTDIDTDGIGDACDGDIDTDGDGVQNDIDNCPSIPNADQGDLDSDGIGDVCDDDRDGDTVLNDEDNCPDDVNRAQTDTDGDGIGDVCDDLADSDGDGVADDEDNCPSVPNADQADGDLDGVGDVCDIDCDEDGAGGVCGPVDDGDEDGYTIADGDCNDGNFFQNPGVGEVCDNHIDDNCDGLVDTDDAAACPVTCADSSECGTGEVCLDGVCYDGGESSCSTFLLRVDAPWYGEWYARSLTRSGEYDAGDYLSDAECSVAVFDVTVEQCTCFTSFGESPCRSLPASPDVIGCVHNQRPL